MEHCNELPTHTNVETTIGSYENDLDNKIYWMDSYDSVIGVMLYLTSGKF